MSFASFFNFKFRDKYLKYINFLTVVKQTIKRQKKMCREFLLTKQINKQLPSVRVRFLGPQSPWQIHGIFRSRG